MKKNILKILFGLFIFFGIINNVSAFGLGEYSVNNTDITVSYNTGTLEFYKNSSLIRTLSNSWFDGENIHQIAIVGDISDSSRIFIQKNSDSVIFYNDNSFFGGNGEISFDFYKYIDDNNNLFYYFKYAESDGGWWKMNYSISTDGKQTPNGDILSSENSDYFVYFSSENSGSLFTISLENNNNSPAIDNEGTFTQTNNGFTYSDIQFNGNGDIKVKIQDLTDTGSHQEITVPYDLNFPIDIYANNQIFAYRNAPEDTDPIVYNDYHLNLQPGHKYSINYEFLPSSDEFDDTTPVPSTLQVITTPGLLYYEVPFNGDNPPTQEDCQDGTTLKQISVQNSDGTYKEIYACIYPDPDNTIVQTETTLSGSTINVNVENTPTNNITVKNDIKLFSGSSDFSGTGEFDKGFSKFGDYFSKFGEIASGTLDNMQDKFKITGIQEKTATVIADINQRLNENENNTCEMFNSDGSFKSYGILDIGLNFNVLQGNNLDFFLTPVQKMINFFTNPINNILALSSVFEGVEDNKEICYLGFKQKIEYQSVFKSINDGVKIPNMNNGDLITIGKITVIDYFVLIVFGLVLVFGVITIFSRLY